MVTMLIIFIGVLGNVILYTNETVHIKIYDVVFLLKLA